MIEKIFDFYRRLGIWQIENKRNVFWRRLWESLYLMLNMCLPASLIIGGLLSFDKNKSIFSVGLGVINSVLSFKLSCILWRQHEIRSFVVEIECRCAKDFGYVSSARKKLEIFFQFSTCFLLTSAVSCVLEIIFYLPIFSSKKQLPLDMWFQFDWNDSGLGYWLVFMLLSIAILIAVVTISLNVIIWYLMISIAIKYEVLGHQFRHMVSNNLVLTSVNMSIETLHLRELIRLIKVHRKLDKTVDRFKSCFENLFLMQIVTSGICICAVVYALAFRQNDDLVQLALNSVILLYTLFDILMVMYLGYDITLSSSRLSYNIFESDWMEQSIEFKRCVIIVIEHLKRPQRFVIGKLFVLNLETFTSIINFAYSTFNILKNFK